MGLIEILIELDAWDCFVYSGALFVITLNNEIHSYDWHALVESLETPETHMALQCTFLRADYAQGNQWKPAMTKTQFFESFRKSVRLAVNTTYHVDKTSLARFLLFRIDNPLKSISSAFTIYKNNLYLSSRKGLFAIVLPEGNAQPSARPPDQLWDGRAVGLAGGGISSVAVAAGSEGAFRYRTNEPQYSDANKIRRVSGHHTTSIDWSHVSIFRSSLREPGELIAVTPVRGKQRKDGTADRIVGSVQFAAHEFDYTWTAGDNIYGLRNNTVSVFAWQARELRDRLNSSVPLSPETLFHHVRDIQFQAWKGEVVSAGGSEFGTVIECKNALVVGMPDGTFWTAPHQVARWRTYNRATYYWNQLHLINERTFSALGFTDSFFTEAGELRPRQIRRVG